MLTYTSACKGFSVCVKQFSAHYNKLMKFYKMKVVRWKHQHGTEGIGGRRLGRPWPKNGLKLHRGRRKLVPVLLYRCENWTSLKQHDKN